MIRYPKRHTLIVGVSLFVLSFLITALPCLAQQKEKLYDPGADASAELDAAIARAGREGKHVLVQVGGNWCSWCVKLDGLMKRDARIDSILNADYLFLRVNYSKENRNTAVLERLAWPQRFGFPVLVVLDGKGARLHTQDSGLLEKDGGHDPEMVARFLRLWASNALSADQYRE